MRLDRGLAWRIVGLAVHGRQLVGKVTLDCKVLCGNATHDQLDFGCQRLLEPRTDLVDVAGHGEIQRPDDAVDHRDRDLKTHLGWKDPLVTQRAKDKIRIGRVARITEPETRKAEAYSIHTRSDLELPAFAALGRQRLLDAVLFRRSPQSLEIGMSVEHL